MPESPPNDAPEPGPELEPELEPEAFEDARAAVHTRAVRLLERGAESIGLQAGAKAVFGEPIERHGRTVIPVAQAIIGAGVGTAESAEAGVGAGGGAGALTRPVGYIEMRGNETEFVPLRRPWQEPVLVLAYATLALIAARTLVRLTRGV